MVNDSLSLSDAADNWFKGLATVHDFMITKETRPTNLHPPVKCAIIDTGVDYTHPYIQHWKDKGRICAHQGFPETLEALKDDVGHGTQTASVFLRTDPYALLCVARVDKNDGQEIAKVRAHYNFQLIVR